MFYLNSILNIGISQVLVFQLEVYYEVLKMKSEKIPLPADQKSRIVVYKVDRLLTGLTAQQKGFTA